MGKVLVLYDSASGNTEKMAGLVAEGVHGIPSCYSLASAVLGPDNTPSFLSRD
jgi:hypothetical protein